MKWFKNVDKIYCVNLSGATERKELIVNEFTKLKILNNITFIDGVYNEDGAYGSDRAKINIIKDAKANNYSKILILEDDIVFNELTGDLINNIFDNLPDNWDLFYLGGFLHRNVAYETKDGESISDYMNRNQYTKIADNIFKVTGGQITMMHSVCIKNTMFDLILDKFEKLEKITCTTDVIEHWVNCCIQNSNDYNIYFSIPYIFTQRNNNYSYILKGEFNLNTFNDIYQELLKY